ncbi:hypothetical protein H5410_023099 [Solanum commersonii]|uniref:MADS-box domain-containing protein n=1 Tax=Solanum commersonii TaxID=4109 RepID=A0A9J5ZGL3_SOLCO|nr:hypothetical protein H5410_023099 [Solanum commersonii]
MKATRYASFLKHRLSLYKAVGELTQQHDVDKGIVLSSPTNKPYSFFHPTTEAIAHQFKIREDVASNQTIILDQVKHMKEIGGWEDIYQLKTNELINFEA